MVFLGDFNKLLKVHEKKGGVPRAYSLMQNFRDALDHCGFVDLRFSRLKFTCMVGEGGSGYGRDWIGELQIMSD